MTTGKHGATFTEKLAEFVAGADFNDLPAEVVHDTKRIILDTIGCGIGGYSLDKGKILVDLAKDMGGKPEATVFVSGDKVACANAAFTNADLANALDADETFLNFSHFANVVIATALAISERVGASGKDLIAAVALGFDIAARVGLSIETCQIDAIGERMLWAPVSGWGFATLGGAAAAGKILNLDKEKMADALGLAGANAISPSQAKLCLKLWPGRLVSMQKYVGYGFIAYTSVLAGLLAQKGHTGDRTILDGDEGFWRFSGGLGANWSFLTDRLGEKWWISEDALKLYPSCRFTHGALDLFLRIVGGEGIRPEDIESVIVRLSSRAMSFRPIREPLRVFDHSDPNAPFSLQFSLPYLISVAAIGIAPGPDWYSKETLTDPRLRELMKKVELEEDPRASEEILKQMRDDPTKRYRKCPCSITVAARGKRYEARADYAKGDPWLAETRLSDDQLKGKVRTFSRGILDSAKIEKAIELVYNMEKLDDLGRLTALLSNA